MRMWQSLKYDFTVVAINIICITLQMTERFWTIFFLVLRFDIATLTDHRRETTTCTQDSSSSERELGQALARDGHGVLSQSCLVTHSELAACQYNEKCRVLKFVRCESHTHTHTHSHNLIRTSKTLVVTAWSVSFWHNNLDQLCPPICAAPCHENYVTMHMQCGTNILPPKKTICESEHFDLLIL